MMRQLYSHICSYIAVIICAGVFLVWQEFQTSAATIHTYRDLISTSAPSTTANHTVDFTTTTAIPPSGTITFTLDPGDFTIPAVDFDIDNVALYEYTAGSYVLRSATGTPSATDDGVVITSGVSGNVQVTLNSSDGIPANTALRLLLGTHTPLATTTDVGILNPPTIGSYAYYITTNTGTTTSEVRGYVAIVDSVEISDIDTTETVPPVRFNGLPAGPLPGTTMQVQISLETDEFAKCRYATASGTPFLSMGNEFGSDFATVHASEVTVTAAADSATTYTYYVRCIDDEGNTNTDDYAITFIVLQIPTGTPGDSGDNQDGGNSTGGGSGGSSGGGTGGSSGSGGSGGGGGGGSGGGGGGQSGSDGGGLEGTVNPYQSGDGEVIITGYAFPRSEVVILVDGEVADTVKSGPDGEFSITLEEIARGAYTFGVYGIDKNGVKSSTFAITFTVTGSRVSTLSNINVMPTIRITPDPVQPGSPLTISGFTIPNATVTLENQNDKSSVSLKTFTAQSDSAGAWSTTVDTTGFSKGTYKACAKAKQETGDLVSTNFSAYTYYGVGESAAVPRSSDLNRDGKVNLIDFSILLFWWNTDGGNSNPPADINQDGKVSLTDFSILVFNWTG